MKNIKNMYSNDEIYKKMKQELLESAGNHDLRKRMIRRFKEDYACTLKKFADTNLAIARNDWQNDMVSKLSERGLTGKSWTL